jgi:hypothetical protein
MGPDDYSLLSPWLVQQLVESSSNTSWELGVCIRFQNVALPYLRDSGKYFTCFQHPFPIQHLLRMALDASLEVFHYGGVGPAVVDCLLCTGTIILCGGAS